MSEVSPPITSVIESVSTAVAEKGWAHQATGVDPFDTIAVKGLLLELGKQMTGPGSMEPEFSLIAPSDRARTFASGTDAMSFHTDNVYLVDPCTSVALFCAIQANEGGHNELVDGLATVNEVSPEIQEALRRRVWKWEHPAHKAVGEFEVLDTERNRIRWWRRTLLVRDIGLTAAADVFEKAINEADRQTVFMQPGDILVTDNTRILHNRSSFIGERRMYRARFWRP